MAKSQGPFYEALGARIAEIRQAAHISQQQLAECAGMSRPSMVNIEKGRQPVDILPLMKMAEFLKVSLSELLPPLERKPDPICLGINEKDALAWVESVLKEAGIKT